MDEKLVGVGIKITESKRDKVTEILKEKDLKLATVLRLCVNYIIENEELPFTIK